MTLLQKAKANRIEALARIGEKTTDLRHEVAHTRPVLHVIEGGRSALPPQFDPDQGMRLAA